MRKIELNHITKIEGHAELTVKIEKSEVKKVNLKVFEGARFFESILKGRKWDEVPYLTSRICGVCSVAHHLTAIMAVEDAFDVKVSEQTKLLRELLYNGNLIQSHVLHLFFLVLPDYLGYSNAIAMASEYKDEFSTALKLKQLGNEFVSLIGGRELHAITPEVGGFSKVPSKEKLSELSGKLKAVKNDVMKSAKMFMELDYPKFDRQSRMFALHTGNNFSITNGEIECLSGECFEPEDYTKHFHEYVKKGSTAKTVLYDGKPFMVGALARININKEYLSKDAGKLLEDYPLDYKNPYHNNPAQAIELVHLFDRCIEILDTIEIENESVKDVEPYESRGVAVSEAPRGILIHDYKFDKDGYVQEANIIPPTTQNLKMMEEDIKNLLPQIMHKKEEQIKMDIEKLIRAYDPCISCSAHFLRINWDVS